MAKRQAVQLQSDLQSDDEFDKFLELSGLLVIDVYSEWCGPCISMLNALKKVKLEQGGDILNLAIARADTITQLQRFSKKSEPTWLFITQRRTVNIMFGVNCPKLISLILEEMKALGKPRETYDIKQMLPVEVERDNKKNAAKRAKLQKELDEQERKRSDYFHYVTDTIRENLPDVGITIFGPHIHRDAFRHLIDYGPEKFGIVCKDRRTQIVTKEQFDIINYVCKNPLSPDILEAIEGKELFICFWKVSEQLNEHVADTLQKYADDIVKSHRLPPDEYRAEEQIIPPLATTARVQIEFELPAGQECPAEEEPEPPKESTKSRKNADAAAEAQRDAPTAPTHDETHEDDEGDENDENEGEGPAEEPKTETLDMPGFDMGLDDDGDFQSEGEEEEETIDDTPQKNICSKTVTVPAIWVPKDWRTHAAVIYLIFRTQTTGFLPPDPVPEPPHVIMAFDTYKKKDLINFAERNKEDIPLYGFFTSDEADEAKFIANSKNNYAHHPPAASDKLIFKVNKRTSHTMLSLATYGPTYVSPNTAVGAEDAKVFFPDSYISAEQELLEALSKKEGEGKGKGKKGAKAAEEALKADMSYERMQAEAEAAAKEADEQAALEGVEGAPAEAAAAAAAEGEEAAEGEAAGETLEAGDVGEGAEAPPQEGAQEPQAEETPAPPPEEPAPSEQPAEQPAEQPPNEAAAETPAAETTEVPA